MKRKKIVAGNWKMNLALNEAVQLAGDIKKDAPSFKCDVVLIPSFVFITEVEKALNGSTVKTGAQNCSANENGAYTGEVSASMLTSANVEYVIIGHSERRTQHHENNDTLRAKLQVALKHGLIPIFCCGEPLEVREANEQETFVEKQLEESLFVCTDEEIAKVIIAYQPVWAIGTGVNATLQQAQQMHGFIRSLIQKKYSLDVAQQIRIIYGGSCNPSNAKELFACPDVDGGLIGGASLKAKDFLAIIHSV